MPGGGGGGGGGAAAVVVDGKDGYAAPARAAPRSFPAKLLRPVLLSAVLATGFLAAALLMFFGGASSYYRLPRLAVPDALLPAPTCDQEDGDQQGGAAQRWWARPPARSAWHNMSEEELLWAASFEPRAHQRRPPGRRGRTPKVAFLFLTRGPLPLAPLWERFFNSTGTKGRELFSVYVHTTPGYRLDFPPSSPFHRRQVPSKVRPPLHGSSCSCHQISLLSPSVVWMVLPAAVRSASSGPDHGMRVRRGLSGPLWFQRHLDK
uniref:Uncharacterized protein n=1 Tax=Aegilops tauschii subsp. strangulata TaxID=200361 RepID=A0A453JGT3_AEGTS